MKTDTKHSGSTRGSSSTVGCWIFWFTIIMVQSTSNRTTINGLASHYEFGVFEIVQTPNQRWWSR